MKSNIPAVSPSPKQSARKAGLHYTGDQCPGISRISSGAGFSYRTQRHARVRDPKTLRRIKALAIPPAWTDVWICSDPNGHLQAVGRDTRGRKQYRYHDRWREVRDKTKYNRMIAFGKALPRIRQRVRRDLRRKGLVRERILAALVRLLELSALRVGNDEYANHNNSYGLTTLRDRHAEVRGARVRFRFRGKGGKMKETDVEHPLLARIVRKCQDLPGQDLFQYVDDAGEVRDITSGDVNDYLAQISGQDFTAKDFRTWTGTVLAALALRELTPVVPGAEAKRNLVRAVTQVAERLGNTPSVCKECYIHPVILESYLDGALVTALRKGAESEMRTSLSRLRHEEAAVITLLQQRLKTTEGGRVRHALKASLARGAAPTG